MPIYEYYCNRCQHHASVLPRSFSVSHNPACPTCGSRELSRLISRFLVLKSEENRMEAGEMPEDIREERYGDDMEDYE